MSNHQQKSGEILVTGTQTIDLPVPFEPVEVVAGFVEEEAIATCAPAQADSVAAHIAFIQEDKTFVVRVEAKTANTRKIAWSARSYRS